MMWGVKGTRGPTLSVLCAFHRQRVLVTLQCAWVVFILRCVVAVDEGMSRLGILSEGPPLSLFDMLLATEGGPGTCCSPCGLPS